MTSEASEALLDDLKQFLRSSATNVERMSDQLRGAVTITTGLQEAIGLAIANKQSVVVAGTAGSGKTHLLNTAEPTAKYDVHLDLAALPEKDWKQLLGDSKSVLVAGNEGAFLKGVKKELPGFQHVIDTLHEIQSGSETPYDKNTPVVIDAAGYDPAGSRAISQIVSLQILSAYVSRERPQAQRTAWAMLSNEKVRDRLARVVEVASAESDADGFTFRQLWQFVADMIEGAEGQEIWADRVFEGASEVSARIRVACDPSQFALPGIANRLWHRDLLQIKDKFLPEAVAVLQDLLAKPVEREQRQEVFRRLRLVAAFGLVNSPLDTLFERGADLWSQVRELKHAPLLKQINKYFCYGLLELGTDLELWVMHETERRLSKPDTQASLGAIPSSDFRLVRSKVIGNLPKGASQLEGGRLLLVHTPTKARLNVTKDLVEALLKTRSHRTQERRDVEYDWRLGRFFERIANQSLRSDLLRVAHFDFHARTGRWSKWSISSEQISRID